MKLERRAAGKEIDDLILVDPVREIETAARVIIESQSLHSHMLSFLPHISTYSPSFGRDTEIFSLFTRIDGLQTAAFLN